MFMNWQSACLSRSLIALALSASDASAHHVGGRTPKTFAEGIFSCFGHSIIALDHFAAVVAMGCLAAVPPAAVALVVALALLPAGRLAGIPIILPCQRKPMKHVIPGFALCAAPWSASDMFIDGSGCRRRGRSTIQAKRHAAPCRPG